MPPRAGSMDDDATKDAFRTRFPTLKTLRTATMDALDLTKRPPRSPRDLLPGLDLLMAARTVDKIRATLAGGNIGEYQITASPRRFSTHSKYPKPLLSRGDRECQFRCGGCQLDSPSIAIRRRIPKSTQSWNRKALANGRKTRRTSRAIRLLNDFRRRLPTSTCSSRTTPSSFTKR